MRNQTQSPLSKARLSISHKENLEIAKEDFGELEWKINFSHICISVMISIKNYSWKKWLVLIIVYPVHFPNY